jgi:MHS family proline/betaine transporter-like MFS transporter
MISWPSPGVVYAVTAVLASLEALVGTTVITMVIESMPRTKRATVFGVLYAAVVALFGGFAQFIVKFLIELTGSALAPAAYLLFVLIIAAAGMLGLRETAPRRHSSNGRRSITP